MKRHLLQAWRSKFARNVAIVATGTAAAQIVTIAFSPIITRLYGPEAFGVLGAFVAILAIVTPLSALSYPIAIVLPRNDSDAIGLVKISIKIGLLTAALVSLVLLIAKDHLIKFLNIEEVGQFIWFVPLNMLLSVFLAVATQWVVREKLFKLKAKVAIVNALVQNSLKSGIGLLLPYAWVLVTVTTVGVAINACLFFIGIKKIGSNTVKENSIRTEAVVDLPEKSTSQLQLAKKYNDFAYFRTPQIVLNAASQSMPVLMLAALFGPAAAGFYALGKMVLAAPSQLLGQSVGTVFYPHFNETVNAGKSGTKLIIKATISLAVIGIVPFGIVIVFGPLLFEIVFGEEWQTAGEFARWLALWTFVGFINRPSVSAIPVLKLQGFFLCYEVISTLLRASSLYFAYITLGTAIHAVVAFSLVSVFLNLLLIAVTICFSKRSGKLVL